MYTSQQVHVNKNVYVNTVIDIEAHVFLTSSYVYRHKCVRNNTYVHIKCTGEAIWLVLVGVICRRCARRTLKCFLAILSRTHLLCGIQSLLIFCLALTCFKGAALRNLGHLERFSKVTPLFSGRGERQVNHLLTPRSYYWHKALALLNFLFGAT